ncbi:YnfA family protein [uncultured Helicobacter sp.]|uniref:YnfA family protein n=1 Tax=uncultured Helicobacter sp. TaxID=175537 RepID=UPI00258C98D6|nr:YnfA family protein [uncultured Helicobacter sp.]
MILKSLAIFILSAFLEVGGGYLVWLWLKSGKPLYIGLCGCILLALYGIVATFQAQGFGRVYATYGGIFIAFSILWAMWFDDFKPDKWDMIGAFIALFGVGIIMYMPRD